ncbi:MAG: efflux RND transporter permease subunit [Deltaproteobacteria bacterium]|nr:efflux RND transporter permease subunit [Deltaproteobacteria bacterium]
MWIVALALRRPYTFVVAALLLLLVGFQVARTTPTDILPSIDVPVISVVWTYSGLPAQQVEQQMTQFSEYSLAGNVAGIQRLESNSFDGLSVIKLYFHQDVDVASATAQVTAISQTIVRRMPPGTFPPIIVRYNASSVPILQLAFRSATMSEAEVFDYVNTRIRSVLSVIRGTRFPLPAGGKFRQIVIDLDPEALRARGLSPNDVTQSLAAQNLVFPTGSAKLGEREYRVTLNSSPDAIEALNDVPVKKGDGPTFLMRDVGFVHDGFQPQTNIARLDGSRAVVLSVMKTGDASTLDVAARVRAMIPELQASAPPGFEIQVLADQSTFVSNAVQGLLVEGIIAAALTALMILLFLGSWRSTLIVAVSIPLSVLAALLAMRALGQTINTMTLGGLALAVGILVDDATVEIENIHRNLAMGKTLTRAILDGARQIAVPAFVASTSISIVFLSVFFLEGAVKFLFLPIGMAVGFSVMFSYLLSRTLIPTMVKYLLAQERHGESHSWFGRVHAAFERGFLRFRDDYGGLLDAALAHPGRVFGGFFALILVGVALFFGVGRDFFPRIDGGQVRLHVLAPAGTRIEETERYFSQVEAVIRREVPEQERLLAFIGLQSGYTVAITDSANVSSADGEILIVLSRDRTRETEEIVQVLRTTLAKEFPELGFYFQPADMVTQILSFGVPAAIDVQVTGMKRDVTWAAAKAIEGRLRGVSGVVDVRVHQQIKAPRLHVEVDRVRAAEAGVSQREVANNLLLAVSNSGQVSPTFWTDPVTGNGYPVAVQIPEHRIDGLDSLSNLSLVTPSGPALLGDLASIERRVTPVFVSHTDVQPTYNVRADVAGVDLGHVEAAIDEIIRSESKNLPPGARITMRGQIESMRLAFSRLLLGLIFAAVLVYALMVINFQSWTDPLIIVSALPGAGVGILLALFATQTTINVPSFMGAIMSVGVATANSILVVTFANERRADGLSALAAAQDAGRVRLRPVLMTALAMAIGMIPMALGLGEGAEQNAALARAAIGGLAGATFATLFFVPVVYSKLRRRDVAKVVDPDLEAASTAAGDVYA